jgi:predicted N-acetyltransferase YhbS
LPRKRALYPVARTPSGSNHVNIQPPTCWHCGELPASVEIRIDYLANHPQFIPTLARWHHAQWGYLHPGQTLADRALELRQQAQQRGIPTAVVAISEGTVLASALLTESDMDTHPELTPWLASVYVDAEHRRRGIGSTVVQRIIEEARALHVPVLYLFTPDRESFYARLGWRVRGRELYHGEAVVLMELALET